VKSHWRLDDRAGRKVITSFVVLGLTGAEQGFRCILLHSSGRARNLKDRLTFFRLLCASLLYSLSLRAVTTYTPPKNPVAVRIKKGRTSFGSAFCIQI
jgi:hypothetical protein